MPSHDRTLDEIKDRLDIVDLISEYVNLKKAGQNWKGLCPFHTEKTPSFTVSPAKQIFHCFGCGSGGDIFTFLTRYESLTFPEALKILATRAGVTIKKFQKGADTTGEKETLLTIHRDALEFFQQYLKKNAKAIEYLKERGITSNAQNLFSLGFAPRSWNALLSFLERKGHKADTIKKAGLVTKGTKGHYDTFRGRIIFPIHDHKGDVVAFGGRSIDGSDPKYLNSPETLIFNKRRVLYGLHYAKDSIKKNGHALLMEGYLDVITAHLHGFTNALAPLGTALTQEHDKLIRRFTEDVIIVFDSDPAGIKAAKNSASILLESGLNVRILSMPENQDPDSFLQQKGDKEFRKLVEHPLSIVDFFMLQKGERRSKIRETLEAISKAQDKILQGEYIKALSEKLNANERDVRAEFQRLLKRPQSGYKKASAGAAPKPKRKPLDEEYIIQLLCQIPEKVTDVCGILSSNDFKDDITRSLFNKIKNGAISFNELLAQCEGEEVNFLTGISTKDDFEDPEKVLEDCIKSIRKKQLDTEIKEAKSQKDSALLTKLLAKRNDLSKSQTS
jgi:DNA primase